MQIKDMNSEELKALIENTIDETLESYFGDPDEGKTLKEEVKQRLLAIRQRREVGKKGMTAAEVYQRLGIKQTQFKQHHEYNNSNHQSL